MSETVVIAIVGASGVVAAALISFVTAMITTRRTALSQEQLEQLKLDQDKLRILFEINHDALRHRVDGLESACRSIQNCRDKVRLFLDSPDAKNGVTLEDAMAACHQFIAVYGYYHTGLLQSERLMLHEAKNISMEILRAMEKLASPASQKRKLFLRQRLLEYVEFLNHVQQQLLIARDNSTGGYLKAGDVARPFGNNDIAQLYDDVYELLYEDQPFAERDENGRYRIDWLS